MSHYEVLIVPVLSLVDYFLTVVGAKLAEREYRRHFIFPDYELNPGFQKQIAAKQWVSLKHLILVVLMTGVAVLWGQHWEDDEQLSQMLFGGLLAVYATIIGTHLGNIWLFRFLVKRPDEAQGEVKLTQRYLLQSTRARVLTTLLPLLAAACLVPSPYLWGGVEACVILMIVQTGWIWRDARKRRRQAQSEPALPQHSGSSGNDAPDIDREKGQQN